MAWVTGSGIYLKDLIRNSVPKMVFSLWKVSATNLWPTSKMPGIVNAEVELIDNPSKTETFC